MDEIEITVPVTVEASITRNVDKEEWNALTREQQAQQISEWASDVCREFDNGGFDAGPTSFYCVITAEHHDQLSIYDKNEEG